MSIATKTGDLGSTGLLFNRRVPKSHPRVEAYGACDELNAALGLAKALLREGRDSSRGRGMARYLESAQRDLIVLMGEVATLHADRARYLRAGHRFIVAADVERLTREVHAIEKRGVRYDGWATPGANPAAAALDVARTVCRRAERCVVALGEKARRTNSEVVRYLNRLSDLLWLMARQAEGGGAR
jgi:cob(I)alamin adenosyltransferase